MNCGRGPLRVRWTYTCTVNLQGGRCGGYKLRGDSWCQGRPRRVTWSHFPGHGVKGLSMPIIDLVVNGFRMTSADGVTDRPMSATLVRPKRCHFSSPKRCHSRASQIPGLVLG